MQDTKKQIIPMIKINSQYTESKEEDARIADNIRESLNKQGLSAIIVSGPCLEAFDFIPYTGCSCNTELYGEDRAYNDDELHDYSDIVYNDCDF